ncbi:uncharacterized protein LOC111626035 [Centruroides sculpturatus]|uniref:uncharacterized protein LOC111626035 n=1 Tax=Centruroides sculpturatus TaxID=218467 RepID=UPI000C6E8080|nr:uncharacterized protein LOC111626035 [Centruroides sculpturatus]
MEEESVHQTKIYQIDQHGAALVTQLPEILHHIFEYLEDEELDQCRKVCRRWRDVVDRILYKKVTTIKREIPISLISCISFEPEILRPYTGFDDCFQYNWFFLADEPVCPSECMNEHDDNENISTLLTECIDSESDYTDDEDPGVTHSFPLFTKLPLTEGSTEMRLIIVPNIPGFTILNYPLELKGHSLNFCNPLDKKNILQYLCDKINIGIEETKCIIACTDIVSYSSEMETNSVSAKKICPYFERLTIFYGEKINAISVYFKFGKSEYKTFKEKLENVKSAKPKMKQRKCFAYIFNDMCEKCFDTLIRAFRDVFPLVNYFPSSTFPHFLSINPPENYNFLGNGEEYLNSLSMALLVFIWWE